MIGALVADLAGTDLDYWVARARGTPAQQLRIQTVPRTDSRICVDLAGPIQTRFDPSTSWAVGGPIIEQAGAMIAQAPGGFWSAAIWQEHAHQLGPTPLIAAMRAYVTSVYGPTVEAAQ